MRRSRRPPGRRASGSADIERAAPPAFSLAAIPAHPRSEAAPTVGHPADPAEAEADRAADRVMRGDRVRVAPATVAAEGRAETAGRAPPEVGSALRAPGQPLEPDVRAEFEPLFGRSFADVRVHADGPADGAARSIDARAFTLGPRIGFSAGEYAPATPEGRQLLAHELAHVAQDGGGQAGGAAIRRQTPPAGAPATTPPPPRIDYVFIMGDIGTATSDFYLRAQAFYQARLPGAVFVTTERSLTGVLDYLAANVRTPAGSIYIVSHGNEDGTLAFGLTPTDADHHMDVGELRARLRPSAGGSTGLADVRAAVDSQTRIRIKGCDIGRTGEMMELLDESFGGAGTVTAPTHEQVYDWDTARGTAARGAEETRRIAAFTAAQPPLPAVPPPVDPSLRGTARTAARAERARLVQERDAAIRQQRADIQAERTRIQPELDVFEAQAAVSEELSGPLFQRPGTTLFAATELTPEVARLYPHLSAPQQAAMVRRLVAAGTATNAATGDVVGLRGQQVIRIRPFDFGPFADPRTVAEVQATVGPRLPPGFIPTAVHSTRTADNIEIVVDGALPAAGGGTRAHSETIDQGFTSDADMIAAGRAEVHNPGRYAWRIEETRSGGMTTRTAVGERVVAYLYHETLSPGSLPPFNPPESDANFYTTSTFAPPPPPPPPPPAPRSRP